jgi:carboxymethylenebutenolidase
MFAFILGVIFLGVNDDCCSHSMSAFANDPSFHAVHALPQAIDFTPKFGKTLKHKVNEKDEVFFVVPPKTNTHSAVIMIHEWWGLNAHIKREAERLHEATGYGVVAVDLYSGKVAKTREDAAKYLQEVDGTQSRAVLLECIGLMRSDAFFGRSMEKVGVVGYCFGGSWSLQTALIGGPRIDACVIYYGMPVLESRHLRAIRCPVLGIFAQRDRHITPEIVSQFESAMKEVSKDVTIKMYDADHAFANPSNPNYDQVNADTAWKEMLSFFSQHLR